MHPNTNSKRYLGTPRVPVLDSDMTPLMPTTPARARLLLKQKKASAYRNKMGIFSIILHESRDANNQPLALGIDPGYKYEGWSVVGTIHTVLNGMSEPPSWVKANVTKRQQIRKSRRSRKCPRRASRSNNRAQVCVPPSIKSRWQAKLNIVKHIQQILPISIVVVEDVKAVTNKNRHWNLSFSVLEKGKNWFYDSILKLNINLVTKTGWETKRLRSDYRVCKSSNKGSPTFDSHAIDAWVIAASEIGTMYPRWLGLYYWVPIRLHRRQLHYFQPCKGGERRPYGGTRSLGFTRGTLVKHHKLGLSYVGGTSNGRLSLHSIRDGKRLTQKAKVGDIIALTTIHWRAWLCPSSERGSIAT